MSRRRLVLVLASAAIVLAVVAAWMLRGLWRDRPLPAADAWPGWGVSMWMREPQFGDAVGDANYHGADIPHGVTTAPGEPLWILVNVGADHDSYRPRLCGLQRTADGFGPARCSEPKVPVLDKPAPVALLVGGNSPVVVTNYFGWRGPPEAYDAFTGETVPLSRTRWPIEWFPPAPQSRAWRFVSLTKGGGVYTSDFGQAGRYRVHLFPSDDSTGRDYELSWDSPDGPVLSATIPLHVNEVERHMRWCVTKDGGILTIGPDFLLGWPRPFNEPEPKDSDQVLMVFHQGDPEAWRGPEEGKFSLVRHDAYGLRCEAGAAALTAVGPENNAVLVERVRCTPRGCKNQSVSLTMDPVRWWYAVHDFGDRILLLWLSAKDEVRMRLAPLEALSTTKDRYLFTLPRSGQLLVPNSIIEDTDAILMLLAMPDLRAIQITRSGRVAVIPAE